MKLSVVIPTYNSARTLESCLNALENSSFSKRDFEVILVDDGSTDETQSVLKRIQDKTTLNLVCLRQENAGPGFARNTGIEAAKGSIIAFTDSDCIVAPDWVQTVASHIDGHGKALVGGTTYSKDILVFPWIVAPAGQLKITANLAYNREKISEVRFDEAFAGFWGEDTDFVLRLEDQGYKYEYSDDLKVFHPANVLNFRKMLRRGFMRQSEVLLYKRYGQRVNDCFHIFFRPLFWDRFSPSFAMNILALLFIAVVIIKSLYPFLVVASALFVVLFLTVLYKPLVTNNTENASVPVSMRFKTLLRVCLYLPTVSIGRIIGSMKFKKVMV